MGKAISEDEWGWGQHAWRSEREWGDMGKGKRGLARGIEMKCFLCKEQNSVESRKVDGAQGDRP